MIMDNLTLHGRKAQCLCTKYHGERKNCTLHTTWQLWLPIFTNLKAV